MNYLAIVIGVSNGGLNALSTILSGIPKNYQTPIIIVQHRSKGERDLLEAVLQQKCEITIKQADEKENIVGGLVYIAPPDYHLMIEADRTFSLSIDASVRYSRPSIDVLFESAAEVYKDKLIGIILTGSNDDGANGMRSIHQNGGFTIAQNPGEAKDGAMPLASIRTGAVRQVLLLKEIQAFMTQVGKIRNENT
ncbi:MAG: chemotaxis protein CheB [Marivirga sp.]|nr:chemotaxis protein CheB [Marivirga sp.]